MSNEQDVGEDWLECIPWNGDEKTLPSGYESRVPGLKPSQLVRAYKVLDVESDEGYKLVKPSELKPDMVILGAKLHEGVIKNIMQSYGERAILIQEPSGGKKLTRWEWRDKFGTDGLELLAIRDARMKLTGGGIKF